MSPETLAVYIRSACHRWLTTHPNARPVQVSAARFAIDRAEYLATHPKLYSALCRTLGGLK